MPYVPSFFLRALRRPLTFLHALHVFMVLHTLRVFTFWLFFDVPYVPSLFYNMWNNSWLTKTSWHKQEWVRATKNSLNKPKHLQAILENYFKSKICVNIFLLRLIVKDFNIPWISCSRYCSSHSKGRVFPSALKLIFFRFKKEKISSENTWCSDFY